MRRMLWTGALAALGVASPTDAQTVLERGVVASLAPDEIGVQASTGAVSLEAFPLPDGRVVDLQLRPFRITNDATRFVVGVRNGEDIPFEIDHESMIFLRGSARGDATSGVFLSVSERYGTVGSLRIDGRRYDVTSNAGPLVDLEADEVLVTESITGLSGPPGVMCTMDTSGHGADPAGLGESVKKPGIRQIEVAVETDYEYAEPFDDLEAAGAYMLQLYGAISDIYIRDLDCTVLVTFVRLWDDPDDLWDVPDLGAFRSYWNDNMQDVHRDVAQFVSGNRFAPWGGVAYLNGLCNGASYSIAAYNLGFFETPDTPSVFNRDITVTAHELGHNAGTPHTHDLGIDTCNDPETEPQRGSIMAYCGQTFTGGTANHDLRFHTVVQDVIAQYVATRDCLAFDCNLNGIDDETDIAEGTSEDANGNGVPDECEDCNANGVFDDVDIASGTSPDQNGNGLPDECEPDCNGNGVPDDLDISGMLEIAFIDTFETDAGWTPENLGATSGDWERGVPVDDPDWDFDPESDSDGSGQCWLTENAPGNTDVDEGAVRLVSPALDLSHPESFVAYDYFLRLTNDDGDDRILVEGSDAGLDGPWAQVRVHDTDGGLDWRTSVLFASDLTDAGLELTADMRLRFTANDGGEQSVVEAGLDRFIVGTFSPPTSLDAYGDGVPDECEDDLNENLVSDYTEVNLDMALDLNRNAMLDAYEDCDGDGIDDLTQIGGAHNAWLTGIGQGSLRQFLSVTGTMVSDSEEAGIDAGHDVVITPDERLLVSSATDSRIAQLTIEGALMEDLVPPGADGLDTPNGLLLTEDGRLLVASAGTDSVKAFDATTGDALGDLVAPGAGGLVEPFAMTIGPDGALYVSSGSNEILAFDVDTGEPLGTFVDAKGNGGLIMARGLLFLEDGTLLVTSYGTDEVLQYDTDGTPLGKWNKNGTDSVLTLDQPWDIGWGPDGNVYVTRTHDHEAGDHHGGWGLYTSAKDQIELHLTNARLYAFDPALGNMIRAYVVGVNSGIEHPTGFVFRPAGNDCNQNLKPDSCDIASGTSSDNNDNGIPDECEGFCLADFNGDGELDILDFVDFQIAFQAGDEDADVNGDGLLNILDFVAFQIIFVEGCEA